MQYHLSRSLGAGGSSQELGNSLCMPTCPCLKGKCCYASPLPHPLLHLPGPFHSESTTFLFYLFKTPLFQCAQPYGKDSHFPLYQSVFLNTKTVSPSCFCLLASIIWSLHGSSHSSSLPCDAFTHTFLVYNTL